MSPDQQIPCALHDQIEVACLYRYVLEIRDLDGEVVSGRARTTRTEAGVEYLVIDRDSGISEIPLHRISTISVLTPNAVFSKISF